MIPLQMISHQVFPDLDKIVDEANWDIAKTDLPSDVKEMRKALETPDSYLGNKQYSISCELINSRFNDQTFPVHLNETFFCQYCESDRFLGITCKSVGQIMQVYGEDLALKAEKTDKSSEPACLACLYLVKVSPENGFKLLEFLREKPVYHKEGNCNELLNQAAKKYQEAVLACEQDIDQSMDVSCLTSKLISKGVLKPNDVEYLQNPLHTACNKNQYMFKVLKNGTPEQSRLFLKALEEEDQHSGHEGLAKTIRTKLQ